MNERYLASLFFFLMEKKNEQENWHLSFQIVLYIRIHRDGADLPHLLLGLVGQLCREIPQT